MDPLTALGLASNIIQLITFASDLVSKGCEIYKSSEGVLVENLELETITTTLQELSKSVQRPDRSSPRSQRLTKTERKLHELCHDCSGVSEQLLSVIRKLKAEGPVLRWDSFRQALNSVWKEKEIAALETRLERYRRQLDTTLLISLREHVQELSAKNLDSDQVRKTLLRAEKDTKQWKANVIDCFLRINGQLQNQQSISMFSSELSAAMQHERGTVQKLRILETLRFHGMEDRFGNIAEAHKRTFEWVFLDEEGASRSDLNAFDSYSDRKEDGAEKIPEEQEDGGGFSKQPQGSNFIRWIHGDSGLYWVTGKPGSGKSTLMKFLHDDSRTQQHVTQWSAGFPLVIAGFFFWNAGTTMQMSRLGLFQTLLYDAIKNDAELVPILFAQRWRSYQLFGGDLRPWSMTELAQAFRNLIADTSKRFFFFIDGLDEFDGDGAELVDFIAETLTSRTNVKICVASRPWLVFEDAFKCQASLRLEDLTAPDIHLYVTEKLRSNAMFVELEKLRPDDAKHLIDEVTGKASGVFLWVHLVTISLLEGLRDGDSIADLQDRLSFLPSDLEKLFSKILERLNPLYFRQASWLFQLVRGASEPLSLLSLALAEEGLEKAMSTEVKPMPKDEIAFRAETMRRRLNSRCKGLIEAPAFGSDGSNAKVQYLHRTVRDYLNRIDIWEHIVSGTDPSLDVDLSLCGAFLRGIKIATPRTNMLTFFWRSLQTCLNYAVRFEGSANDFHIISILEELERAGDIFFSSVLPNGGKSLLDAVIEQHGRRLTKFKGDQKLHWVDTKPRGMEMGISGTSSFFDLAFGLRFHSYIQHRLDKGFPLDWRIHDYSLLYTAAVAKDILMLKILFEHGADPNLVENSLALLPTSWHRVLESLRHKNNSTMLAEQADIVELFLENGADPGIRIDDKSIDVVIKNSFHQWDLKRTSVLLNKLAAAKAAQKKQKRRSRVLGAFFKRSGDNE
jgi:hypothetical protein